GFVDQHLFHHRTTPQILLGQFGEVTLEVAADLVFRGGNEAKAYTIADQSRSGTDSKRQTVPKGIEVAGVAAQLVNTLLTPDQVIHLLSGGLFHLNPDIGQSGSEGLTLIKRLGADFPG